MEENVIYEIQNGTLIDLPNIVSFILSREDTDKRFQGGAVNRLIIIVETSQPSANNLGQMRCNSLSNKTRDGALKCMRYLADSSREINRQPWVYFNLNSVISSCCDVYTGIPHTHASKKPSSRVPFFESTEKTCSLSSSKAFVRVISSFFNKFLKEMTSVCSEIRDRSGGSAMYVRADGSRPSLPKLLEKPPKDPKAPAAARLLEACDLNFLLMWGMRSAGMVGETREIAPVRHQQNGN